MKILICRLRGRGIVNESPGGCEKERDTHEDSARGRTTKRAPFESNPVSSFLRHSGITPSPRPSHSELMTFDEFKNRFCM